MGLHCAIPVPECVAGVDMSDSTSHNDWDEET